MAQMTKKRAPRTSMAQTDRQRDAVGPEEPPEQEVLTGHGLAAHVDARIVVGDTFRLLIHRVLEVFKVLVSDTTALT